MLLGIVEDVQQLKELLSGEPSFVEFDIVIDYTCEFVNAFVDRDASVVQTFVETDFTFKGNTSSFVNKPRQFKDFRIILVLGLIEFIHYPDVFYPKVEQGVGAKEGSGLLFFP